MVEFLGFDSNDYGRGHGHDRPRLLANGWRYRPLSGPIPPLATNIPPQRPPAHGIWLQRHLQLEGMRAKEIDSETEGLVGSFPWECTYWCVESILWGGWTDFACLWGISDGYMARMGGLSEVCYEGRFESSRV